MVDPANLIQPPRDPKRVLVDMERGVFDAMLAISAALDAGILVGFAVGPTPNGAIVELIFPRKEDQPEDSPNPSRAIESATPIGAMASAGEVIHQLLTLDNQNHGNHQEYCAKVREHRELRKSIIIKATLAVPGKN